MESPLCDGPYEQVGNCPPCNRGLSIDSVSAGRVKASPRLLVLQDREIWLLRRRIAAIRCRTAADQGSIAPSAARGAASGTKLRCSTRGVARPSFAFQSIHSFIPASRDWLCLLGLPPAHHLSRRAPWHLSVGAAASCRRSSCRGVSPDRRRKWSPQEASVGGAISRGGRGSMRVRVRWRAAQADCRRRRPRRISRSPNLAVVSEPIRKTRTRHGLIRGAEGKFR
jgi:hypothetical protein